jgi:hypothetical protein
MHTYMYVCTVHIMFINALFDLVWFGLIEKQFVVVSDAVLLLLIARARALAIVITTDTFPSL